MADQTSAGCTGFAASCRNIWCTNVARRETRSRATATHSACFCRSPPISAKQQLINLPSTISRPTFCRSFSHTWSRLEVAQLPPEIRGLPRSMHSLGSQANAARSMWNGVDRFTVPFKRTGRAPLPYMEKDEIDELLRVPDRASEQGQRDYALLLFLYNSGARATEAVRVAIEDLTWDSAGTGSVKIRGKGRKIRFCPLWKKTMAELEPLIRGRGHRPAVSQPIRRGHDALWDSRARDPSCGRCGEKHPCLRPSELARIRFVTRPPHTCSVPALI